MMGRLRLTIADTGNFQLASGLDKAPLKMQARTLNFGPYALDLSA
jgi:hypothetical protein